MAKDVSLSTREKVIESIAWLDNAKGDIKKLRLRRALQSVYQAKAWLTEVKDEIRDEANTCNPGV